MSQTKFDSVLNKIKSTNFSIASRISNNKVPFDSLLYRASPIAKAYHFSSANQLKEIKMQDVNIELGGSNTKYFTNSRLLYTGFESPSTAGTIGNMVFLKEIHYAAIVKDNIPLANSSTNYISPGYIYRFALVYSNRPYNTKTNEGEVRFDEVFADYNAQTQTYVSNVFSARKIDNLNLFTVLFDFSSKLGTFSNYPSVTSSSPDFGLTIYNVTPPLNQPPFSQFFQDHIQLWNVSSDDSSVIEKAVKEWKYDKKKLDKYLFNKGLECVMDVNQNNIITSGSLWLVTCCSPDTIEGSVNVNNIPTLEFWCRVLYTD